MLDLSFLFYPRYLLHCFVNLFFDCVLFDGFIKISSKRLKFPIEHIEQKYSWDQELFFFSICPIRNFSHFQDMLEKPEPVEPKFHCETFQVHALFVLLYCPNLKSSNKNWSCKLYASKQYSRVQLQWTPGTVDFWPQKKKLFYGKFLATTIFFSTTTLKSKLL